MDPEEHGLSDQFLPSLDEDKLTLLQVPALARNGAEGCASHTPSCSVSILLSSQSRLLLSRVNPFAL